MVTRSCGHAVRSAMPCRARPLATRLAATRAILGTFRRRSCHTLNFSPQPLPYFVLFATIKLPPHLQRKTTINWLLVLFGVRSDISPPQHVSGVWFAELRHTGELFARGFARGRPSTRIPKRLSVAAAGYKALRWATSGYKVLQAVWLQADRSGYTWLLVA